MTTKIIKVYYLCHSSNPPHILIVKLLINPRVTVDEIEQYFKCVYETTATISTDNIFEYLEELFTLFNSDDNPLSTTECQKFIRENKSHTSMSVGDVISIDGDYYIVDGMGFKSISK